MDCTQIWPLVRSRIARTLGISSRHFLPPPSPMLFNDSPSKFSLSFSSAGFRRRKSGSISSRPRSARFWWISVTDVTPWRRPIEASIKGGLFLDTKKGIRKGGDTGPAVIPGNVSESPNLESAAAGRIGDASKGEAFRWDHLRLFPVDRGGGD